MIYLVRQQHPAFSSAKYRREAVSRVQPCRRLQALPTCPLTPSAPVPTWHRNTAFLVQSSMCSPCPSTPSVHSPSAGTTRSALLSWSEMYFGWDFWGAPRAHPARTRLGRMPAVFHATPAASELQGWASGLITHFDKSHMANPRLREREVWDNYFLNVY